MKFSRRNFLKAGTLAGTALAAPGALGQSGAGTGKLEITVAGYEYNVVRALSDGRVQIEGCNMQYQPGKIGDLNTHVFSGPQTLMVTEIGLIPFVLAYANDSFRDYSLIPVFPASYPENHQWQRPGLRAGLALHLRLPVSLSRQGFGVGLLM